MPSGPGPNYQQPCGWNALLPPRTPNPPLVQDRQVDVTIVGAGYTGIAAARRWQELAPDDEILLLDASGLGEGNPGRNSGFLLEIQLAEDARPDQLQRMTRCNALLSETARRMVADLAAAGTPDAMTRAGTYRAAASDIGRRALANYRAFLEAAGLPFEALGRDALAQRLGTGFYREGLYSPHCYLAQPAQVIRSLASRIPPQVTLHENTPVSGVSRRGASWKLHTPRAEITSKTVLLSNNGHARYLGVARSRLASIFTYAGVTAPLDDSQLQMLGSDLNWGLLPTHKLGSTLRRTADGRLLLRSLHSYERELPAARVRTLLTDRLQRRFPQLGRLDFQHVWGGAVGYTHNGGLVWGEQQPGLYAACGCNGGGTVKGTLFGRLLAELALGKEVPDVPALFGSASWMPPEPLRRAGFSLLSGWQGWTGRDEA